MKVINHETSEMINAYGIKLFNALSPEQSFGTPFYPSFCRIERNGQTAVHSHFEVEVFLILKGSGRAIIDGKEITLKQHDQLIVHPFEVHQIFNTGEEELEFYSIYSNQTSREQNISKSLILSAPPTPNGRLHLGHFSGPYLSADVYRRFLKLKGVESYHVSGTDDFQTYTNKLAQDEGTSQREIVAKFHSNIKDDLERALIETKDFISPIEEVGYQEYIKQKFEKLVETKYVSKSEEPFPVDTDIVFEAYLNGICPECKDEVTGQCCENCGFVGNAIDFRPLGNQKKSFVYSLAIEKYKAELSAYHQKLNLSAELQARVKKWRDNLKPFNISYPKNDGIEGIHVWVEMAFGLLYHLEKQNKKFDEITYCFGIDNAFYYLILVPSILIAMGEESNLPQKVIINKFYNLDQRKFSTSRNHAVWINDIEKESIDYLRFYIARNRSEKEEGSFSLNDFYLFTIELNSKLTELFDTPINYYLDLNKSSEFFKGYYRTLVDRLIKIENSLMKDFSLNSYAKELWDLIDEFYQMKKIATEEGLIELGALLPLIHMSIAPLMPELVAEEMGHGKWSYDLRRLQ